MIRAIISIDLSPSAGYLATGSWDQQARVVSACALNPLTNLPFILSTHRSTFIIIIIIVIIAC